jgi:hypothetical protein
MNKLLQYLISETNVEGRVLPGLQKMQRGGGNKVLPKAPVDPRVFPKETLENREKVYRTVRPTEYTDLKNYIRYTFNNDRDEWDDARSEEAFKLYLGLADKPEYFRPSKYKPTINATPNEYYYSADEQLEQDIFNSFKDKVKPGQILPTDEYYVDSKFPGNPNAFWENGKQMVKLDPNDEHIIFGRPMASRARALGQFVVSRGKDDQGEYLSYADQYDFPEKLQDKMQGKPYKIYGRVYYPKDKPKKVYGGENPFLDMLKQKYGGQPCYQCGGMYDQGGPILDPRGQWAHPGKVTRIPSDNITMQGVNYPVLGVGSNGQQQMMYPEQEYDFGGASYVDEYPMMQFGGGTLLGPLPMMSKIVPKVVSMFSGDPLKKFINWVNEPSETTSRPSPLPVEAPVRTYGYSDTHSEYRDRANDVYSELKNNDSKEYNSPKQISLSSGRFRGAKVDPEMINDIVNAAKANNVDPWVMLSLVGRESTFGSGAAQNTRRAGNKQDLVSGWNVAEDYMPYEFNRFLADRQVPGVKVHKDNHGWQYTVEDKKVVDDYLKKNPQLIDSYYKKIESTPNLDGLDSFALAAQRIKKKGIQNYNPGDPKYSSMVNSDMGLLKQDAELKAYMKSKGYREGGQLGGGLLSKSVSCSNCGWSWKAVDGGIAPMTCHKCGGMVKMQCGGYLPIAQDGRTIRAANGEFSCAANPRSDLRASAASVSGGSSDPLQDAKNNYWSRIKEDWQAQGVNKESFNNMYEDSLRAGPAFENPLSSQYFDPSTGKARPGTPGRLRYYKEAGYPLGTRPTLEQIKNTALEQPKGVKGYNKLVKDDYPWGVSPYIPTKKNGGRIGYMQGGGLWGTDKVAYLDSTVNANKNLDFIQRAMQDNGMSIPTPKGAPGYGEGKTSSHLMTFDPKSRRAYPELVNMNGSLKYLTGDAAYNYAEDNGEYIQFPTSEQADYFSQNYKKSNYIKVGKQPLEKKHGIKVTYKK